MTIVAEASVAYSTKGVSPGDPSVGIAAETTKAEALYHKLRPAQDGRREKKNKKTKRRPLRHPFGELSPGKRSLSLRIVVLILSLASVFLFGRALGGLGGYLIGIPRPDLIVQGLVGGVVTACLALLLWHDRLRKAGREDGRG